MNNRTADPMDGRTDGRTNKRTNEGREEGRGFKELTPIISNILLSETKITMIMLTLFSKLIPKQTKPVKNLNHFLHKPSYCICFAGFSSSSVDKSLQGKRKDSKTVDLTVQAQQFYCFTAKSN